MLSEPLFTRTSTGHSATPFLLALSKYKPSTSLPISKKEVSFPVKAQTLNPHPRKREDSQGTAPEQVAHVLGAFAIAHTAAMSKRLFQHTFLSAQSAVQNRTEGRSLFQAAYSISTQQEAASLFG